MAHGEMSREEFAAFNGAWMSAVLPYLDDGGLLATFIDWRSVDLVIASGLALELALLNLVVWEKSNGGQGSLWRSQHELLPVFKKGVAPHVNNVELGATGGGGRMSGPIPVARPWGPTRARASISTRRSSRAFCSRTRSST